MSMKPILFNTDMVRAILDGRKTVTRRVVKPQHLRVLNSQYHKDHPETPENVLLEQLCEPPYQPGGILYVRETWYYETFYEEAWGDEGEKLPSGRYAHRYVYKADNPDYPVMPGKWHPSIHMPREAARIFLRVTDVRVERLQDITPEQAMKEGVTDPYDYQKPEWYEQKGLTNNFYVDCFAGYWDSNTKPNKRAVYGWDANPWVWVIAFERISREEAQCD